MFSESIFTRFHFMEDINIALLIDADNISAKYVPLILSELSKYGKITVRRMYGDWTQDRLHSWMRVSQAYSLTPVMQPNNTPGKNASDIGLIIDAMDILYTGHVEGFCIVSSDGDFNKLATRLREAGKIVIGMGEQKTPEAFRASCERFIFLDILESGDSDDSDEDEPVKEASKKAGKKKSAAAKKKKSSAPAAVPAPISTSPGVRYNAEPAEVNIADDQDSYTADMEESDSHDGESEPAFTDQSTIENAIVKMIMDNNADGKETGLGEIGSRLVKIFPDFDIRNYHYSKLSEYLADLPSLNVTQKDHNVSVSLKITSDEKVEQEIHRIFAEHHTTDLNLGMLKEELQEAIPSLDATIRRSGVTRFSVYLNRNIHSVEVNGRHVTLLKDSK